MTPNNKANTKRVAILIENAVEDAEFQIPYKAMQMAGFETVVLGSRMNEAYKGKQGKVSMKPDGTTTEARAEDFDAVIIPGGMAPDFMRKNPNTVRFVQQLMAQGKVVASVCHGPQVLIEGDLLKGRNATGFISIRKDMENAGANYIDEPLVVDGNLITSRLPGDLAIFTTAILSRLGYGGKEAALPAETDATAEWWKLADSWGGSTKGEIVSAINTALAGERYSHEAFEQYLSKTSDTGFSALLREMIQNKRYHIQLLEARLDAFGEKPSLQAKAAEPLAKLNAALKGSDEMDLLRRTLGDVQTGVVDLYKLYMMLTDPITVALFRKIEVDLAQYEQRVAAFYHQRYGSETLKPAKPTTGAILG
ncbi:DJ-1/PfpI/YhbO family deglycase/protease [Microcoleus sp. FACHB-672]|uniref:DJ-1/PfpI/YhbO family deglycase/protease n=1 Tax=Microcoleus sp. FACHB-672 TaxID=2692825 RepID=UPI0016838B2A|nr:DJ-1/PfpI/YhbO family deglycase/protease [Microcoleus sp. FACHB-672]MBD2042907.1 DJ-1/PfpI/YhbO family deglycase/protease [Microcoleus sp. FACHB-672]